MIEKLVYRDGIFYFRCSYENRHLAQKAKFSFHQNLKCYYSKDASLAARLKEYADVSAFMAIMEYEKIDISSRAVSSDIEIAAPSGKSYLPFQRAGINYLFRRKFAILADEQGLGKTIQAIGTLNKLGIRKAVIIAPVSLLGNWERELFGWLVTTKDIGVARVPRQFPEKIPEVLVLSYGLFSDEKSFKALEKWLGEEVFDALIIDEAHRLKNYASKRTVNVLDNFSSKFSHHYILTGTPIDDRPVDIYPILKKFAPDRIDSLTYWGFAKKFNGAHEGPFGWQLGNGSNLDILNGRLRGSCFLRREKSEVLKELPPKFFTYVYIPKDKFLAKLVEEEIVLEKTPHYATARKALGLAKLSFAVEYIKDLFKGGKKKLLIFAWHTEVIEALEEALKEFNPVSITGDTPPEKRTKIVDIFQRHDDIGPFIGNIQAAGEGLTLTASQDAVFVEMSERPSKNNQAMDRCHRIGQKENVNIHFLLVEGSLDERVLGITKRKSKDIEKIVK